MERRYSIIVPIYKIEQYITQCIESIIHQTYKNIEIILVDDGSDDNCPVICDEYALKDDRIKVIHKENGGLVSARKAGALEATGDYICCVDGDDYIAENYIEEFEKKINETEAEIVCCGYYLVTPEKQTYTPVNARKGYYSKDDICTELFPNLLQNESGRFFLPTVWGKAIRAELYKKKQMEVPDQVTMGEDGACTVPCIYAAHSLEIMDKGLYYYRYNESSMTKGRKPLSWECQLVIAEHYKKALDLEKFDFREQYSRRIERGFFTVARTQFNKKENFRSIRKDILEQYKNPIFGNAIKAARFKGGIMSIVDFFIKHKSVLGIYILSKLH